MYICFLLFSIPHSLSNPLQSGLFSTTSLKPCLSSCYQLLITFICDIFHFTQQFLMHYTNEQRIWPSRMSFLPQYTFISRIPFYCAALVSLIAHWSLLSLLLSSPLDADLGEPSDGFKCHVHADDCQVHLISPPRSRTSEKVICTPDVPNFILIDRHFILYLSWIEFLVFPHKSASLARRGGLRL